MRLARVIAVLTLAGALGACVSNARLKRMSSGEVGCDPDDIRIEDHESGGFERTWTALCRGRRHHCVIRVSGSDRTRVKIPDDDAETYTSSINTELSCAPEQLAAAAQEPEADGPMLDSSPGSGKMAGEWMTAMLRLDGIVFAMLARPTHYGRAIALRTEVSAQAPVFAGCEALVLVADGTEVGAVALRYDRKDAGDGVSERLIATMDRSLLQDVADASEAHLRLCEHEWEVGAGDKRRIEAFLDRARKEAKRQGTWTDEPVP